MKHQHQILEELRSLKPKLVHQYKIKRIGIFGSFARNEQKAGSDIDVLIEMGEPLGWNFFDLQSDLESFFQRKVDLVTPHALHPTLKETILDEVIYA